MKTENATCAGLPIVILFIALFNVLSVHNISAQVCNNPGNVIFGITGTADIHYVDINTGVVGARINPPNSGTAPNLANAMGYNQLNGKLYYFKRNIRPNPQNFVVYDPITNTVTRLANCPSTSIINLGCCTADGLGYYCIDAYGILYYYRISSDTWVTISNNLRDQFNITLPNIISGGATPTASSRIYGDMAIDGSGNMWILISGPTDYGLYKLPAPLPTAAVAGVLTITELVPPATPSPGSQSFGGVAFNLSGEMFMSTNAGDNKLYRMEKNLSLTYLSTMSMNGIGTDLASCNYPMFVLPVLWKAFAATPGGEDNISLAWSIVEERDTKAYIIEHSIDGESWEVLATVAARGRNGNIGNYAYLHANASKGKHYYRIGRIDIKNISSYSGIKVIYTYGNLAFAVWPNPAQDVLQIETNPVKNYQYASVMISDLAGRMLYKTKLVKGVNQMDIKMLKPGHYLITLEFANAGKVTHKFIKQ